MPATTSTQTRPSAQSLTVLEAPSAKSIAREVIATNHQTKATQNQRSAVSTSSIVIDSNTADKATADKNEKSSVESGKAPVRIMAQPAQQWRNCSKPHRI
ncbi:MAG: hypothetical protein ACFB0D_12880 [Phormidesmis sp.]